jgi:hypothetical protein
MAFDPEIGQAFDFYEDDLAANQQGVLSSDQSIVLANAKRARGGDRYGTELAVAEGPFSWESTISSDWVGYIGGVGFAIDRLREEALETGATYRLYYLAAGKLAWVMSIERL